MSSLRPLRLCLTLAILASVSGAARANWGAMMDRLSPVETVDRGSATPMAVPPVMAGLAPHHVRRSPDGLFYVDATVNDRRMRFVVDTGASVTVLTGADARAIGIVPRGQTYEHVVETAGGNARMAWTTLAKVQVGTHEAHNVRAAIVPDGLGVSLMGLNMLATFDTVTITSDRLSLH